jgi:hypothetical protein
MRCGNHLVSSASVKASRKDASGNARQAFRGQQLFMLRRSLSGAAWHDHFDEMDESFRKTRKCGRQEGPNCFIT